MTDKKLFISEAEFHTAVAKAKEVCKAVVAESGASERLVSISEAHFDMFAMILEIALLFGNTAADGAVDYAKAEMKKDRS